MYTVISRLLHMRDFFFLLNKSHHGICLALFLFGSTTNWHISLGDTFLLLCKCYHLLTFLIIIVTVIARVNEVVYTLVWRAQPLTSTCFSGCLQLCISSHMIKLKRSSQLIGQFGHVTASAVCKQPEKHSIYSW
jgi:hypothetical protein